MTDLPATLREMLAREVPFSSIELQREMRSRDGTVKALFTTADGRPLEAVLMRYRDPPGARGGRPGAATGRRSVCLSSQSGCPLTCTFCATGTMRFARNLTASEILDQALHFRRVEAVDHCVFMGMGEPMLNLDAVLAACERLPQIGITHRRTTISTVGWIPGIEALAQNSMPLRLALSLHAPEDSLRSQLMPVNDRYPLADVLEAARAFHARKHRRVFVEYVMLAGVNDRYEQALALARLLGGGPDSAFKVNLIPFNPAPVGRQGAPADSQLKRQGAPADPQLKRQGAPADPQTNRQGAPADPQTNRQGAPADSQSGLPGWRGPDAGPASFRGSSRDAIESFRAALAAQGVPVTVRLTRGRDIAAACGQLAAANAA